MFEDSYFERKKLDNEKLIEYGFKCKNDHYFYSNLIVNDSFKLTIEINKDGQVKTTVYDLETNYEYIMYKVDGASGDLAGKIKNEVVDILKDISEKCFINSIYKSVQANLVMEYIEKTKGDKLEFLWSKDKTSSIFRRKDNQKWYGCIMVIPKRLANSIKNTIKLYYCVIITLKTYQ